jgi:hypothetical protein
MASAKVPSFNVDDFTSAVTNGLDLDEVRPTELAAVWDFHQLALGNVPGAPGARQQGAAVTEMPTLPAAKPVFIASGQSTVLPNASGTTPALATPNAANTPHKDLDWITGAFIVPAAPLIQQWTLCYGPSQPKDPWKLLPTQLNTSFLAVTAWRSEKMPDGNWNSELQVDPMFNIQLKAYPQPNDRNEEANFVVWADRQMSDIATPAFPTQAPPPSGTLWKDPIAILQAKLNPPAAAPGTVIPSVPTPSREPQSRLFPLPVGIDSGAFMTVASPGYGGGSPAGGGGGGPMGFMGRGRPMPRAYTPPSPEQKPGEQTPAPVIPPQSTEPTVVFVPGAVPTVLPVAMTAPFNPGAFAKDAPDILIYFNDGTAQPGKTYRYRLEYKLLNPLFNKASMHAPANHQEWLLQLDLTSAKSEFSPEITVPQKTYLYCAKSTPPASLSVGFPFEVFTWADGLWRKQTFAVFPGDVIGGVDNNYDFSTGYTYVDGARRYAKFFVTLVDDSGTAEVLDAAKDVNSADHKIRTEWVEQQSLPTPASAANPNAPPGYYGGYPPPNMPPGAFPMGGGYPGYGPPQQGR